MKRYKLCLLILLCLLVFFVYINVKRKITQDNNIQKNSVENASLSKLNVKENNQEQEFRVGKNIPIIISDDEYVDAKYLQKVLDGDIKRETPYFDLWDAKEFKKMIDYMDENNLIIAPGEYELNQAWYFEDGFFILPNNVKYEAIKFNSNTTQKWKIY